MSSLAHHYEEGGWVMHWILVVHAVVWGVLLERVVCLCQTSNDGGRLVRQVAALVRHGRTGEAVRLAVRRRTPISRVVLAGLLARAHGAGAVRAALEGALLKERPRLARNGHILKTLADCATLFGLFGSIIGLIGPSFGCVRGADPTSKATALAKGVSESLNCTAFGLFTAAVAIAALVLTTEHRRRAEAHLTAAAAAMRLALTSR